MSVPSLVDLDLAFSIKEEADFCALDAQRLASLPEAQLAGFVSCQKQRQLCREF